LWSRRWKKFQLVPPPCKSILIPTTENHLISD
jgi:hypothetical protein